MFFKYISIFITSFLVSQDIEGTYQLYGFYAIYQDIARYDTPINVTDNYGLNITIPIDQIDAGEIYLTTYRGPYGHQFATGLGVNINVTFNFDGTGFITQGSILPSDELNDDCTVETTLTAFTDNLLYTSDLNAGLTGPFTNIIGYIPDDNNDPNLEDVVESGFPPGYENPLIHQGENTGSMSLSQTAEFDFFPSTPTQPYLCDNAGNCFDVILENGDIIPGGTLLPGFAGGYVLKDNLQSIAPTENECADLYLEWHAIDGPMSGNGLGDEIGVDEDGDGTDFDRIWGLETVTVTKMKLNCGYNHPIYGDVSAEPSLIQCVDYNAFGGAVGEGNDGYVWDASLSDWGNFLTYNAVYGINSNDSDHDYNGTDGRLVMNFLPTCIPDIMVRHLMLEFKEIGGEGSCTCPNLGDINADNTWNVLDIVTLANCVLTQSCTELENSCAGDVNGDGTFNVLDIVTLANCVLTQSCGE